ncbi:hypothetical protein LguiA_019908 [Lonicera macranthoides]
MSIALSVALAHAADPITSLMWCLCWIVNQLYLCAYTSFVAVGSIELTALGVFVSVFNLVAKLFNSSPQLLIVVVVLASLSFSSPSNLLLKGYVSCSVVREMEPKVFGERDKSWGGPIDETQALTQVDNVIKKITRKDAPKQSDITLLAPHLIENNVKLHTRGATRIRESEWEYDTPVEIRQPQKKVVKMYINLMAQGLKAIKKDKIGFIDLETSIFCIAHEEKLAVSESDYSGNEIDVVNLLKELFWEIFPLAKTTAPSNPDYYHAFRINAPLIKVTAPGNSDYLQVIRIIDPSNPNYWITDLSNLLNVL